MKARITLLLTLGLMAGCMNMSIKTKGDNTYAFERAETYCWIPVPSKILNKKDTFVHEDIQKILEENWAKMGLTKVSDQTKADLHIVYYIKLKESKEYSDTGREENRQPFSGGLVYNQDKGSWAYTEKEPDLNIYSSEIGTLTILVYNAKTGARVWKGSIKTTIDRSQSKGTLHEQVENATNKLLERFPIKK